jgi:threonine synthase
MNHFSANGSLTVDGVDDLFAAGEGNTEQTLATIRKYHDECDYTLDPHTAVGVAVAERFADETVPTICLATAHPAKFTDAIEQALGEAVHHPVLDAVADAETRCETIANDEQAIRDYLVQKTRA